MATTLGIVMKKAASSVIPLANKRTHTNYTSAFFMTPLKKTSATTTIRSISTSNITNLSRQVSRATLIIPKKLPSYDYIPKKRSSSDEALLRVIKSEIDDAYQEYVDLEVAEAPREFPFKIEDNLGKKTLILTRQYQGEEIKVTVRTQDPCSGSYDEEEESNSQGSDDDDEDSNSDHSTSDDDDEESNSDGNSDDDEETNSDGNSDDEDSNEEEESNSQYVDLVVNVSKENQPTLEFNVTAYADGITINHLAVMNSDVSDEDDAYKGREFSNFNEDLQKAFEKYLEVRGIEPSITNFLHDYMVRKEQNEYAEWLRKLRNIISN